MNNVYRYLSAPPDNLRRRPHWEDGYLLPGFTLLMISTVILLSGLVTAALIITGSVESNVGWNVGIGAMVTVSGLGVAASLAICLSFTDEIPPSSFGHDRQARGLYDRIKAVTKHSTAGWDDDLWQAFFTIGKLIDEKKSLTSVTLAQELHDEIETLVAELDEMITARQALVDQRRRLGMELTVPGTEAQRIEVGAVEEMEELAMRPLLRQRIAEIKNEGPGELT